MGHASTSPCRTVAFYAVHEGRVLMVNHKKMNRWLPPGGHIEEGETTYGALLRELEEETQLEHFQVLGNRGSIEEDGRVILPAPSFLDVHEVHDEYQHEGFIYFIRALDDRVVLNEEEHSDIRWFSIADMKDPKYNFLKGIIWYSEIAIKFVDSMDRP